MPTGKTPCAARPGTGKGAGYGCRWQPSSRRCRVPADISRSRRHRDPGPAGASGDQRQLLSSDVNKATSRVLADGHADRTWDERLRELVRFDVLVLDDFPLRQPKALARLTTSMNSSPHAGDVFWSSPAIAPSATGIPSSGTLSSPSSFSTAHQHQPPGHHERTEPPAQHAAKDDSRQASVLSR